MKVSGVSAAAHEIQVLFEIGTLAGLSDGQLLDRFIDRREEVVFEALSRRHASMVWGVCRRVLRDHHDAEDAFQATFLVLARKAEAIMPREKLGHWLYGVAVRTALKSKASRARRRGREIQAPERFEPECYGSRPADDLLPALDLELSRLPEKYRIPIVLCELEGKTHREAGEQLGWPIGTVSGRLSRGKEMLGRRLARRGVAMTVVALTSGLTEARAAATANGFARLIGPTARAAGVFAASRTVATGSVPAEVLTLAEEVRNTMLRMKLKAVVATIGLGMALTAGGTCLAFRAELAGVRGPQKVAATPEVEDAVIEEQKAETARSQTPPAKVKEQAADPMASYAYKIDPENVLEFPELRIDHNNLHLKSGPVSVAPISTDRGITGVMLIGNGTFRYEPEKDKVIEGRFRSVMLRFNPEEQAAIIPLDKGKKVTDQGVAEMSRHLLRVVLQHCWHRGQEVLIPGKGAMGAVLYTKEHGDLLISGDDKTATAFSFTNRSKLYEKK